MKTTPERLLATLFLGMILFPACQTASQEVEDNSEETSEEIYKAFTAELENLSGSAAKATADMSFDTRAEQPFALLVVFFDLPEAPEGSEYEVHVLREEDWADLGPISYTVFGESTIPMFLYNSQEDLSYYTDLEVVLGDEVYFKGTFQSK